MELRSWRELSDRGPDLVPCLDYPGARAAAGFAELAACVNRWAGTGHAGLLGAAQVHQLVTDLLTGGPPW